MDVTRARFGSAIEWVLAAACILALLAIGSLVVRELRVLNAARPLIAREAEPPATVAAGVPQRAIALPVLLLANRKEVRVGDSLSTVAARLGREAEVGTQTVERLTNGERLSRTYEHDGRRFVLVFEPSASGAEPKVVAIYLQ